MGVGEYLIIFAAILIGLAVADLALSLHRLLRQGRDIKWHPIVPITGLIVLCLILNLWWQLYAAYSQRQEVEFIAFLPEVFMLLVLFLLSAAVFPDERLEKGASLLEFYIDNRIHFWGLFAVYLGCATANMWIGGWRAGWEIKDYLVFSSGNLVWVSLCVVMMMTRKMIVHWIIVAITLLMIAYLWAGAQITQAAAAG